MEKNLLKIHRFRGISSNGYSTFFSNGLQPFFHELPLITVPGSLLFKMVLKRCKNLIFH